MHNKVYIRYPKNNISEREYIIQVLFLEFLGLDVVQNGVQNLKNWEIELENGTKFVVEDNFFNKYPKTKEYLKIENIPKRIEDLDIFAACFFMLTRWEEYVNKSRDKHDRFPAYKSLAYKQNFLDRPIVNEYLEELKKMLLEFDDSLNFKQHTEKTYISCDVDQPFDCTVESFSRLLKVGAGDILKRKSIKEFAKRVRRYVFNKFENYKYDTHYNFDWYMKTCEKAGLKATFYFIPTSIEKHNGCYELKDTKINSLLRYIDSRGHDIGGHGSYQTYQDKEKAKVQKNMLDNTLSSSGISQKVVGNRQHYLRWDSSLTPSVLEYAGFEYDTTGCYADRPGFRYGVCYEFSMFDFLNRKKLDIKQRPLVVMEATLISKQYMGLGYSQKTVDTIKKYKNICHRYGGNFTLLWHNSDLYKKEAQRVFEKALSDV